MRMRISGGDLGADVLRLRFTHVPFQQQHAPPVSLPPIELPISPTDRDSSEIRSVLPDDAAAQSAWAAGIYGFAAIVVRGDDTYPTGALALALGPRVTKIDPSPAVRDANGSVTVKVTCRPRVISVQPAVLVVGDREIVAEPFAGSTDVLTFVITEAPLITGVLLRLRIDGVESLPYVFDKVSGGFVFDDQQRMTIQ